MKGLKNILSSASKIVFILLSASACAGFFLRILEPQDFMTLAAMAFSFYFANKGTPSEEYLGK